MSTSKDPPSPSTAPTRRVGFTEFLVSHMNQDLTYKRRVGTLPWKPVSPDNAAPPLFDREDYKRPDWFTLSLVRFNQLEGEVLHWSLVISPTDDPGPIRGMWVDSVESTSPENTANVYLQRGDKILRMTHILEVRGEPEFMTYKEDRKRKHVSLLEDVHSAYELTKFGMWKKGEEDDLTYQTVKKVARETKPPTAKNRKEATENCQGWCVRVAQELVEKGVVDGVKIDMMKGLMERFDLRASGF